MKLFPFAVNRSDSYLRVIARFYVYLFRFARRLVPWVFCFKSFQGPHPRTAKNRNPKPKAKAMAAVIRIGARNTAAHRNGFLSMMVSARPGPTEMSVTP